MRDNVVPITSRLELAFDAYSRAKARVDTEPTFQNAEAARKAWKAYIRVGLNEQEAEYLDGKARRANAAR